MPSGRWDYAGGPRSLAGESRWPPARLRSWIAGKTLVRTSPVRPGGASSATGGRGPRAPLEGSGSAPRAAMADGSSAAPGRSCTFMPAAPAACRKARHASFSSPREPAAISTQTFRPTRIGRASRPRRRNDAHRASNCAAEAGEQISAHARGAAPPRAGRAGCPPSNRTISVSARVRRFISCPTVAVAWRLGRGSPPWPDRPHPESPSGRTSSARCQTRPP